MFADGRVAQFHIRGVSALAYDAVYLGQTTTLQSQQVLFKLLLSGFPLILYFAVAHHGTNSLFVSFVLRFPPVAPPCITSDDDVFAVVQRELPQGIVLVEKKEHCVLCEQQFDDMAKSS